jgi:hypothetical protein
MLFMERPSLILKFEELNGFQMMMDVLSNSADEFVKDMVLDLFLFPGVLEQYGSLLTQLGVVEQLIKICKESEKEALRARALFMMILLPRRYPKSSMPASVLDGAISSVLSTTVSISKKAELVVVLGRFTHPAHEKHMLKLLDDGSIQSVFRQIMPLTKYAIKDSDLYQHS